jgi:hypothetical protein
MLSDSKTFIPVIIGFRQVFHDSLGKVLIWSHHCRGADWFAQEPSSRPVSTLCR